MMMQVNIQLVDILKHGDNIQSAHNIYCTGMFWGKGINVNS